ncbi:MAG: alpha/beta hydrolase [Gammaproteobacteria bacterium]|nr:alpha/beta hydrolase [Gammaproteobacteria bacterium]
MKFINQGLFVYLIIFSFQTLAIELSECRIGPEASGRTIKAECGKLSVAENRENTTRMIDLNIAVVRSDALDKQADPVIMLAGGPGQSAVESYVSVANGFRKILKDRDVVLVDQRGTGLSNPLKCDFDKEIQEKILENPELIYPEIEKCVADLDADTRYYTTTESIKDLEEVRQALDIEKWNLIGISYGTRKALTYMKLYPNSIRSVILDGVVPQQEPLAASHEKNLISALKKQFAQCDKQAACKATFGDIEKQMWQLFDKVEAEKPEIKLQNFMTGEYEKVTVSKEYIAIAIRLFSYSASSMNLLPLMIDKANNGQYETITSQANMISSSLQSSISNVELSILCAEDFPFYDQNIEVDEHNIFGKDFIERTAKSCDVWPHLRVDASFKEPVKSDLPVLLLSGELDPVTPPEFAEQTMQSLSNAQHLVAKGQGHNVFPLGCMPDIITDFVKDPEQELDTECMEDFDYTPFFITMMGPKQ